jgi:hypothetical protein
MSLCLETPCGPHLKDFDWKLNLTVASDKVASMSNPVALFSFDVTQPVSDLEIAEDPYAEEKAVKNVVVEMNQAELSKFVAQLENMVITMRNVTV